MKHATWSSLAAVTVFTLAVSLAMPRVSPAAGLGGECKTGFGIPSQYICPAGTMCLQGLDKKYCSNVGMVCGWQGTGGYALNQTKSYQGKTYECTPTGFQRQNAQLGEECKTGNSVAREYLCETGKLCLKAVSKMYCSNVGKVCGWQGTSGYTLGQTKNYSGSTYECTAIGFQKETSAVAIGGGAVTTVPVMGPKTRKLTQAEASMVRKVFGRTLNLSQVQLTNTVGGQSRPWTTNTPPFYTVNVGTLAYEGMANNNWSGLLIHELTHVWQGQHGVPFMSNSAWHQTLAGIRNGGETGTAYNVNAGQQWNKYNVEQQAEIVEKWYRADLSTSSTWYPYIRDNILTGKPNATTNLNKK